MIAPLRRLAFLLMIAGLVPSAHATSPTGLGIDYFTTDGQRSGMGTGLSGMADTILSELLRDPANKDCKVDQVEIKRTAERQRELELSRTPGLVDPSSRLTDRTILLGHRITGSVIEGVDGGSWNINLVNAQTGEIVASVTGRGTGLAEMESALRENLKALLEKLCPRAYHLKASTGPYFQIDTEFCGIDKPFNVTPKGEFAGVKMVFTPQSASSGTFTQGGRAYGAQWSGGGSYTIAWTGDSGRFVAQDSYTARAGAGVSKNPNDQMTGTITRLKKSCAR
jgi:hypothetical protein